MRQVSVKRASSSREGRRASAASSTPSRASRWRGPSRPAGAPGERHSLAPCPCAWCTAQLRIPCRFRSLERCRAARITPHGPCPGLRRGASARRRTEMHTTGVPDPSLHTGFLIAAGDRPVTGGDPLRRIRMAYTVGIGGFAVPLDDRFSAAGRRKGSRTSAFGDHVPWPTSHVPRRNRWPDRPAVPRPFDRPRIVGAGTVAIPAVLQSRHDIFRGCRKLPPTR